MSSSLALESAARAHAGMQAASVQARSAGQQAAPGQDRPCEQRAPALTEGGHVLQVLGGLRAAPARGAHAEDAAVLVCAEQV